MAEQEKSFEEALAELEQLVREMESGKLPLESMIGKFEAGSRLVALCRSKLDAMSKKIELLVRDDGAAGPGERRLRADGRRGARGDREKRNEKRGEKSCSHAEENTMKAVPIQILANQG